jgi:flagellar hook-associated protein 1 FlgK
MSSIGQILNTAKEALLTHQVAISVTGANVANVSTPGYSRQRAVIEAKGSMESIENDVQIGVEVTQVQRMFDQFIEARINDQSSLLSYSEARKDALSQIEAIFNESQQEGLSSVMADFWNAWDDLSFNPTGEVERFAVVSAAENLATTLREYSSQLTDVRDSMNSRLADNITQLNSYLADIADTTKKIVEVQAGGGNTNDLMDKRSELLKKVSETLDIQYMQRSDGSLDIFLSNGKALVQGDRYWALDAVQNPTTGFIDVAFEENNADILNDAITGGKLGAFLTVRDSDATDYLNQLNTLAAAIADEVNAQHARGFDRNGNVGGLFFDVVTEAKNMAVNEDLLSDVSLIAASATVNGDGDNAKAMSELQGALTMSGGTIPFSSHLNALIGQIGEDVAAAGRSYNQRSAVMSALTTQKEQVSGVSIDEEMVNLVRFQMGYSAAGKMITATQEMIDALLALID